MNIANEIKLTQFVDSQAGKPFQWGFRDCNTLALHILDMFVGTDYAKTVCGKYKTELGAIRFFRRCGLSWPGILKKQSAVEINLGFERVGDFLIEVKRSWQVVHVCLGSRAVCVYPDLGVYAARLADIGHKWTFRLEGV